MKPKEIILNAIRLEAKTKPNEHIIVGSQVFTFEEFARISNGGTKAQRRIVKSFLKKAVKLYESNTTFRMQMLKVVESQ